MSNRGWHFWLAAGLGSGWLPKAPGTWGSLAALLPAWLLIELVDISGLFIASLLLLAFGCWICAVVLKQIQDKDPGWIVIDEWVGLWINMALLAIVLGTAPMVYLLAFISFRLFDILKPWPISFVELLGPPWWSIMADDVAAGIIGAGVVLAAAAMLGFV
ncbi:phosphatidylglycerophosphatase A [Mariprofundus micogutta]|uniref:Phosphatidylglycerophosphatase A n=1 Tax=Mariprofundus micogutta TaxID=1921010 RepID=A0A1L8CN13_9PROT|nr:phosphatidylglycerophosphatase A [Mariprofundus micogutta]GAV20312.1 phosphatidylglycerophosphatase A [Mariprofundus micogutta]